jgi:hypothetical protein
MLLILLDRGLADCKPGRLAGKDERQHRGPSVERVPFLSLPFVKVAIVLPSAV